MRVIGIDPGTAILGWAYVETDSHNDVIKASVEYGVITTSKGLSMPDRLLDISKELTEIFDKYSPEIVGVENLFFNKNVKTAITVAQARGVIMMEARKKGAEVLEITPLQVKDAIVGYGRADKEQVQTMVKMLLGLKEIPKPDDAADALAVAICTAQTANLRDKLLKAS